MENIQNKTQKVNLDFKNSRYATGRRKTSIAKVWLKKGTGKIYVNGKIYSEYFASENHKMQITRPFELINQFRILSSRSPDLKKPRVHHPKKFGGKSPRSVIGNNTNANPREHHINIIPIETHVNKKNREKII